METSASFEARSAPSPYPTSNPATGAFIVMDRITNNTVGAGMILEHAERRAGGDLWGQAPVVDRLDRRGAW